MSLPSGIVAETVTMWTLGTMVMVAVGGLTARNTWSAMAEKRMPTQKKIVAAVNTADGPCMSAHIAYLGIAGAPIRGRTVEAAIVGTTLDEPALNAAAEAASILVSDDMDDVHATVEYRRVLTGELTKRVLKAAWERRGH